MRGEGWREWRWRGERVRVWWGEGWESEDPFVLQLATATRSLYYVNYIYAQTEQLKLNYDFYFHNKIYFLYFL